MKFSEIKYSRPNLEEYYKLKTAKLEELKNSKDASEQISVFREIIKLDKDYTSIASFVYIKFSQNVKDDFYTTEREFFDNEMPKIKSLSKKQADILLASEFISELEREFGKQYFDLARLSSKTMSDDVVDLMQEENKLTSEYQKIKSEIKINFDGKDYNLSGMSPLFDNVDREFRKRASKAKYSTLMNHQAKFDQIYHDLVQIRHQIALKLGYDNYVQLGYDNMGRTGYGVKDIESYRAFVLKYITPKVSILKEQFAKMLGIEKHYQYDTILFNDGNPTPKTSPEQMVKDAQVMYEELSKETGEFFKFMQDSETLDLVNRDDKSPGGYCSYVEQIKSPFIFSNFNGTSHDVDVLTHEVGHAFQAYCSRDFELEEYLFPTSEAAEIHSMSMEFFAERWVDKFFKEDTDKYKLAHLYQSFSFLCYGVSVDEFQQRVYENPTQTPEERRAMWLEIDQKYSPFNSVDNEEFLSNGGKWQLQAHIYQMPFYYIDYTLAQVCAFQFYQKMHKDFDTAWKDYYSLCCKGGSLNFTELVEVAKLKSPFTEGAFTTTSEFIFNEIQSLFGNFNSKVNN